MVRTTPRSHANAHCDSRQVRGGELDFCRFLSRYKALSAILPILQSVSARTVIVAVVRNCIAKREFAPLDLAVKTGSLCRSPASFTILRNYASLFPSSSPLLAIPPGSQCIPVCHNRTISTRRMTSAAPASWEAIWIVTPRDSRIIYASRDFSSYS